MMRSVVIQAIQAGNKKLIDALLSLSIVKGLLSSQHFLIHLLNVIKIKENNFSLFKLVLTTMSRSARTIPLANAQYLFTGRSLSSILEHKESLELCINELYTDNGLLLRDSQAIMELIFQGALSKLPETTESILYLIRFMGKISKDAPFLITDAQTEYLIRQHYPHLLQQAHHRSHPGWGLVNCLLRLKQLNGQPIMLAHQLKSVINDDGLQQSILSMQALWKEYLEQGSVLKVTFEKAFKSSAHYLMEELLDLFKQEPTSKEIFKQPLLDLMDEYQDSATLTLNETQALVELHSAIFADNLESSLSIK